MTRIASIAAIRPRAGAAVLVAAMTFSVLSAPAAHVSPSRGPHLMAQKGRGGPSAGNLIDHGGTVLSASQTVTIWWGTQSAFGDGPAGVTDFLSHINGTQYLNIASQYMRGAGVSTSSGSAATDASSPPSHSPSVSTIVAEVAKVLGNSLPNSNTVYLVYTSNFPKGASFCAWHAQGTISGTPVQVAYMPNTANVGGCLNSISGSPYSTATQGLVNSTSHEFMEAITDPQITAWYDQSGREIGDKCETQLATVTLGTTVWQIQPEWSDNAGGCVSSA